MFLFLLNDLLIIVLFLDRFDCGMFMIKYADFYSRDIGLCFNQVGYYMPALFLVRVFLLTWMTFVNWLEA